MAASNSQEKTAQESTPQLNESLYFEGSKINFSIDDLAQLWGVVPKTVRRRITAKEKELGRTIKHKLQKKNYIGIENVRLLFIDHPPINSLLELPGSNVIDADLVDAEVDTDEEITSSIIVRKSNLPVVDEQINSHIEIEVSFLSDNDLSSAQDAGQRADEVADKINHAFNQMGVAIGNALMEDAERIYTTAKHSMVAGMTSKIAPSKSNDGGIQNDE